ncbi:MAG: serine/threonine protein kinase [Chloroflexota bacterium]|nr:serine/threonine protein kinase [Chloroflexota bacterium]
MEDRTGQWLAGRYRLDCRLTTDSTGDRYEAWDGEALLRVVVHLFAPALLASPDAATRYDEQASRLRAFGHRGIAAVRGIERDGATLFLVLDAPPGAVLAATMRERETPFSPAEAAHLLRPVADALDALHAVGLVHRRITPETIMVGSDGGGILAPPVFAPSGMDAVMFGPSAFLSPEQATGQAMTGASDIYALGAVVYDMLTGALPFTGEHAPPDVSNAARIPWEQTHQIPIAPRVHTPSLSEEANRALLSALSPHPAARPSRAALLIAAVAGMDGDGAWETAAIRRGDTVATFPVDTAHPSPLLSSPFRLPDDRDATGLFNASEMPEAHPGGGRRRSRTAPVLALVTLLVVASALVLGALVVKRNMALAAQQSHYAAAEAALGHGDYDTAIAAFTAAGAYRDAPARVRTAQTEKEQQANYDTGMAAFGQGAYTAAADAFGKAGGFRDAPQRQMDAARLADQQQAYTDGQHALVQGDYPAAAAAFARAGDYQDATRQAAQAQSLIGQQRQYQTGMDALAREDYATAIAAFRAAGAYQDAPQQATQAEKLRVQAAAYDTGAAAFARADFKTAMQQFAAAGNYKDAPARATQANQEDLLAAKYALAQTHLQASQWKDAYADLQDIKKIRPDYRDVAAVISHLENDVVNPTTVDALTILNAINGYTEAWVPVNNLIGQPVTWLYIVARQAVSNARPDQISAISLSLVAAQGTKEALNGEVPVLAANPDVPDKNTLRAGEKVFVATDKGQTFEILEFGKYRARLTVTALAFPLKIAGNDSAGPNTAFFSHLTVDVTLTPKTP